MTPVLRTLRLELVIERPIGAIRALGGRMNRAMPCPAPRGTMLKMLSKVDENRWTRRLDIEWLR